MREREREVGNVMWMNAYVPDCSLLMYKYIIHQVQPKPTLFILIS